MRSLALVTLLVASFQGSCLGFGLNSMYAPGLRSASFGSGFSASLSSRRTTQGSCIVMAAKKPSKADKLQVLLKANIDGVGKANEVIQVNSGYFNNFLRPKNLASIISDAEVAVKAEKEQAELARIKQEAVVMAGDLKSMGEVVVKRKVGKEGKIFGTITHKQVMEEVKSKTGGKVDLTLKMKMDLPHVEGLGEYSVSVQLHPEVTTAFKLVVQEEK